MYARLSRLAYKYSDMIIALFEENTRKQIALDAPPEKTFVIPNGIDVTKYAVEREEREGFHVGLVGRVVPIKDIKTFISTAKITLQYIPDAHFHCIGPTDEDEMYYQDCVNMVESLKIQDYFTFTGRQNVLEYYSFLDVLLLTSVREAQPLVILEAYIAGVPVVATRVGNIPEMLRFDDRLLAPSKDAEKLAEGIRFIHDNPEEVEQMKIRNREMVYEKYNRKDLHKRYLGIYERYGK
jgi:glycosyltransferase involved in cell wall biosynthesis